MIKKNLTTIIHSVLAVTLMMTMLIISSAAKAQAQQAQGELTEVANNEKPDIAEPESKMEAIVPIYTEFMGVRLGMSADEARRKLGNLKYKGERQDFFVFSDENSAQVFYDAQGKVIAISVDYLGENSGAPSPEKVLGAAIQPRADGSMYQLRRYPEAGYWVAYSRTAGQNPLTTTVTIQKM